MRARNAVLLAAALAGCDLDATAEADSVCVTQVLASQRIPGELGDAPVTQFSLPVPVQAQIDLGSALPDLDEQGITAQVLAQSLGVTSPEGADFSGIEAVSLTALAPGMPDLVFTYTRPAGTRSPLTVAAATPESPANLVDYLEGGRFLRVGNPTFTGRLPRTDWTPALRTCATTKVDLDYLEAAGL
jgi:hypothetical protein